MRVHAGSSVRWPLTISSDQKEVSVHFDVATNSDNAPEWNVFLNSGKDELWSNYYSKWDYKLSLPVAALNLEVQCPKGVRYDDFVDVTLTVDGVAVAAPKILCRARSVSPATSRRTTRRR